MLGRGSSDYFCPYGGHKCFCNNWRSQRRIGADVKRSRRQIRARERAEWIKQIDIDIAESEGLDCFDNSGWRGCKNGCDICE